MSEVVKPKRKRRTKAEMELAKAKEQKHITAEPVKKLPLEQSVLIMSCLNPKVATDAINSAKENGVEVVILEDSVIYDYCETKTGKSDKKTMGDFLNDTSNRLDAENQAVRLWTILTGGRPIEDANGVIFKKSAVVKGTNLSNKKTKELLQVLRVFGLIEFTKSDYEFKMNFNKKRQHQTIQTEVLSITNSINSDIIRFKASLKHDESLSEEKRKEVYEVFKKSVVDSIKF